MSDLKFFVVNLLLLSAGLIYLALHDRFNSRPKAKRSRARPEPGPAPWDRPAPPAGTPPVFLPDPAIRPAYRPSDQTWGTSGTRYTHPTVPVSGHWRKSKSGNLYWVRSHKRRPS
jgi:hypothetical protein